MTKIFCDVCGKEIERNDRVIGGAALEIQSVIGEQNFDLCQGCRIVGRDLDPAKILLEAWKETARSRNRVDCAG